MRAQPHRRGPGILQGDRLRIADPSFRAHHHGRRRRLVAIGLRQGRSADGRRRLLVEHQHCSPGFHDLTRPDDQRPCRHDRLDPRHSRPARLLGGPARRRPPAGAPLGGPRPPPHRHASLRLPRHDCVDAHLGRRLHRLFVAAPLGQSLDEHEPQGRRRLLDPLGHSHHQTVPLPFGGLHLAHQPQARAVDKVHALARSQPSHRHGVVGLSTGQRQQVAAVGRTRGADRLEGVGGEDEDGCAHRTSLRLRACPRGSRC